ncbi:MAG: Vi polysaccharide biosynthesis UDP-N-acetylglucosamine C-6 dehydrogenase TviB, partial [Pseudomonadales bacterium]
MKHIQDCKIAIIGLGYVGLPLAVEFGKQYQTIGFDINAARVNELRSGKDSTLEISAAELDSCGQLRFSADAKALADCDIYIITVPTPIDNSKRPDLSPLESASRLVGEYITPGNIVVYESTVYPGCTEEI